MTIERASVDRQPRDGRAVGTDPVAWPRLLEGTEPIGQAAGSGLREPPYLVRRCDGQIVQLSQLLYVIASRLDGRGLAAIADGVGAQLDVHITPEQVEYVAEKKLAPLGLVAHRDGSAPILERRTGLLGLKFRAGLVSERAVNALAGFLRSLFVPPVVIAALAALVACDVWLGSSHGIGAGLRDLIHEPVLGLALVAVMIVSMVVHECGHAAACRYGGARPGRIGVGIYVFFPVMFTDVTDSYRLSKAGRLRTDLGGVYFNALLALSAIGAYFATGYEPLLVFVVAQQLVILDQFMPWLRLDGYHVVSDLIGVSDLFARIKPVIASLLPGRRPGPRVTELKPWARAAVTTWVLTAVVALTAMAATTVGYAPTYLTHAWQSLLTQLDIIGQGVRTANLVDVLIGATSTVLLLFPAAGATLMYLLLCRRAGASLAIRRARAELTLASTHPQLAPPAQPGEAAHPAPAANQTARADGDRPHEGSPRSRTLLAS